MRSTKKKILILHYNIDIKEYFTFCFSCGGIKKLVLGSNHVELLSTYQSNFFIFIYFLFFLLEYTYIYTKK